MTRQRQQIYEIIGALRSKVDRTLIHRTADENTLSETVSFSDNAIVLKLSFLGPFAGLNTLKIDKLPSTQRALYLSNIRVVLEKYEVILMSQEELEEEVPWLKALQPVTVERCLFGESDL
jgi:hypothetical protein